MPDPAQNSIPDWHSWLRNHPGARFTDWLRAGAEPAWSAATGHRFTRELIAGQVSRQAMTRYLVQDYAFIDRFVALLGAAIHAAPSLADRLPLGRFQPGRTPSLGASDPCAPAGAAEFLRPP